MCVAVPGKIIEINGDFAKVNIMNNITQVNIRLVSANVGDYVLIHAGCVLEVMKKDAAEELLEIFSALEEAADDDASAS
ncbi:MAG TPA: HypC/HybG/HupF family hydrogenase formation chaperone [Mobilitalea sp.]|nr:HypC/HybG/HupF family hydrogenase formation chaperone [Mobilitalea sp.]